MYGHRESAVKSINLQHDNDFRERLITEPVIYDLMKKIEKSFSVTRLIAQ